MEYIQSALLLHSAGKEITEENVTKILEAAGIDVEDSRVKSLVAALEDVDIEEALESAAMPAAGTAPAAAPTEEVEEEEEGEEDEEEDEEDEEEAAEGLGSLFGD